MAGRGGKFGIVVVLVLVVAIAGSAFAAMSVLRSFRADGDRMGAITGGVRALLAVHFAQGRYQIAATADEDGDGVGEYGTVEQLYAAGLLENDALQRVPQGITSDGYLMQALPMETDAAEQGFVVVALPADPTWPLLAIDESGAIYQAPAGTVVTATAQINPRAWPVRQ
ncbi:MAG: hypothetical protein PF961_17405 [Planctomycetota bacterium]|jgi:hypothetical protein|nr:hypothetical protein [Planctomycetota bacterium]